MPYHILNMKLTSGHEAGAKESSSLFLGFLVARLEKRAHSNRTFEKLWVLGLCTITQMLRVGGETEVNGCMGSGKGHEPFCLPRSGCVMMAGSLLFSKALLLNG